jgi:serine/threonine protein kinase
MPGTVHFAAPEVLLLPGEMTPRPGEARVGASYSQAYSLKADVYSSGMLLWTIATRVQPFEGWRLSAVMRAVKAGERPPPLAAGSTPEQWRELVDACLAQDPQQRPAMGHVLQVLQMLPAITHEFNPSTS